MIHNVNRLIPRSTMSYRVSNRHFLFQSTHINTVLWLVRSVWFWFQISISFHWKAYWCKQLDCRKSLASWGVQTVHLSYSKYQADVLCFYYYKYLTQPDCTWVAYVSKISNQSLQLLNCSKTGLINDPLHWSTASNNGGI